MDAESSRVIGIRLLAPRPNNPMVNGKWAGLAHEVEQLAGIRKVAGSIPGSS